jgi:hypothetical protein
MPGKGKYTAYVGKKTPRRALLEKLYKDSPFKDVDEAAAPALVSQLGNQYLTPSVQQGNPAMFPQGVSLDYQHPNAPNFDEVKWKKKGDAATAYFPNIESPGAGPDGQVNLSPPETDPELTIEDIKPNYVAGVPGTNSEGGTGTVNPHNTTEKIAQNVVLGKDLVLGSSQKAGQ